jgi:hypothetical protein
LFFTFIAFERRYLSTGAGLLGTLIFVTMPIVAGVAGTAGIDVASGALQFLALFALILAIAETRDDSTDRLDSAGRPSDGGGSDVQIHERFNDTDCMGADPRAAHQERSAREDRAARSLVVPSLRSAGDVSFLPEECGVLSQSRISGGRDLLGNTASDRRKLEQSPGRCGRTCKPVACCSCIETLPGPRS